MVLRLVASEYEEIRDDQGQLLARIDRAALFDDVSPQVLPVAAARRRMREARRKR